MTTPTYATALRPDTAEKWAILRRYRLVDVPTDRRHHAQLVPFLAEQIQAVIAAEGVFRVAKTVGWFFAAV